MEGLRMKTWKLFAGLAVVAVSAVAEEDDVFLPETEKRVIITKNFRDADLNGNGRLTKDEFTTQRVLWAQRRGVPPNLRKIEKMFLKKDVNKDGELSPDEYRLH